jgi:hypothetical protein
VALSFDGKNSKTPRFCFGSSIGGDCTPISGKSVSYYREEQILDETRSLVGKSSNAENEKRKLA